MDKETTTKLNLISAQLKDLHIQMQDIEQQLFNKLRVAKIIDVTDDKVHIAKQIVRIWETPDGVVIHIR